MLTKAGSGRIGLAEIGDSPISWDIDQLGHCLADLQIELAEAVRHEPRTHRAQAIEAVFAGFGTEQDRGKLIMACGTGKTSTALKIAERVATENGGSARILFAVPGRGARRSSSPSRPRRGVRRRSRCGSIAPTLDVVHHLAQVNVARMLAPLDDPMMREFVAAIRPVERLAAASPGFVWRLAGEGGHGVCVQPEEGGPVFVNVTLWRDYDSLHVFTYRSPHADQLKRRSRWFAATPQPSTALWWVPTGTHPNLDDALIRLNLLRRYGPTPRAFSLRRRFDPYGQPSARRRPRPDRADARRAAEDSRRAIPPSRRPAPTDLRHRQLRAAAGDGEVAEGAGASW